MGSVPIYYPPLLSTGCRTADNDVDGGDQSLPTGGCRSIARSTSARRINSFEDTLDNDGGSVGCGEQAAAGKNAGIIKRCQTAPGYVSIEDIMGREGRGSWWLPEVDGISDPLVRTASRLYAGEMAHEPPRHRRRSPGPLGTRRGSFMHWLVNKYVSPCLGFLAGGFLCGSDASATCPTSY